MAIVVTGLGLTTSLGLGVEECWRALARGESGLARAGGRAPRLEGEPEGPHERALAHVVRVGREALEDAGFASGRFPEPERAALVLGSSLAASAASPEFWRAAGASGLDRADTSLLRTFIAEPILDHVARALDARGETLLVSNACAAGASAVALAADLVASGRARQALAIGFDALDGYTLAGFAALKALASGPVRPFAIGRDGMRLADGFGALLLEREEDALAAGRRPLARLLGTGESADAHHLTHPEPEGRGAALAMERALARAELAPDQVDYVNAHATATGPNDAAELKALERVFGASLARIPISASKAALGHTLGGAGAVEAVVSILALRHQHLPPTLNLGELEPLARTLDLVPEPRPARISVALSNSFGFGGCNASLVLGRFV